MYREHKSYAALTNENDDWQDWPPDTSSGTGSGRELALWLARRADAPIVREYRPSQPPDHPIPEDRGKVPSPLAKPGVKLAAGDQKPRRRVAKKIMLVLGVLLVLAGGAWYGHYWWTTGRYLVSTDDAYVGAKNATLSAKVMGYVSEVVVDDNAHVHEGDVIARIDDGDYQLAVETARDNVAIQQATVARIGEQVVAQQAAVDQAKAQLVSAQGGARRAELELKRQQDLAAQDYASRQTLEQAQANRDQGNAAVQAGQAALEAAQANVDVLKAQQVEALRTLKLAEQEQ
jgi:membrane fusion protein (multidrug efflux system)